MPATSALTSFAESPVQRTPLIGRTGERTAVGDLLRRDAVPLVTMTGPGGVGKTRLALQIGADVEQSFTGGVRFVDLAPLRDPEHVAQAIASSLEVRDLVDQRLEDRLRAVLSAQQMLLILDNFEHLLPAAPSVAALIATGSPSKILVTSRERLHLYGEHVFPIEPLPTPLANAESPLDLSKTDASRLFVVRAQTVHPDFALTEANAPAVAEICRKLEGLPLAIELAAGWSRMLTPAVMLKRLEKRLGLLTGGPSDVPERQRTMRETIGWSYDLLDEEEQRLFRRLAVFVGSYRLEEATAVGAAIGLLNGDAFDLVASLIDKNLVERVDAPEGELRIRMFETLREFGLEQLRAAGEEETARAAHAATYFELALSLKTLCPPRWLLGSEAISRLAAEQDNIRAAMSWFEQNGDGPSLLKFAIQLGGPWYFAAQLRDVPIWLEQALVLAPEAPAIERGFAHLFLGFYEAYYRWDMGPSAAQLEQSRAIGREIGYPWLEAVSVAMLGIFHEYNADYATAEARFTESIELGSSVDPTLGLLIAYHRALMAQARGDVREAASLWESTMATGKVLKLPQLVVWCLMRHSLLASEDGDPVRAAGMIKEFLALGGPVAYRYMSIALLITSAAIADAVGDSLQAARLIGASDTATETTDLGFGLLQSSVDGLMRRVRDALGPEAFDRCRAEGRLMRPAEVAVEIDAVVKTGEAWEPPRETGSPAPFGLTSREIEVLHLLIEGRSNPQIADALFISPRTVQTHLTNCYGKLGVSGRAEAVAIAIRQNLA